MILAGLKPCKTPRISSSLLLPLTSQALSPTAHRGVSFGVQPPPQRRLGWWAATCHKKSGQPAERDALSEQPKKTPIIIFTKHTLCGDGF